MRIHQYLLKYWHSIAVYGILFAVIGFALYWQLNSLLPGYSMSELSTYQASISLKAMLENPLNAPFLLAVKAASYIFPDNLVATRVVSVAGGMIVLAIFTVLLRVWHDRRTAVLGALLFGLSAWFLHIARLGTPEVLLFGVFALTACGYWLKQTGSILALLVCFLGATALLYTPGMVWFIALAIVWQWKVIDRVFKKHLLTVILSGLLALGALAPLGWALYKHHELIKPWLGLPHQWPNPVDMVRNVLEAPYHLFISHEGNPVAWLGTAPILDVFSLTMFVLGGYLYLRHGRLARTPLFIAVLLLTMVLVALGGPVTFTVVIPFIYLVVAAGAGYLINQWLKVFPRNPIAHSIGFALMYALVGLACLYHVTHYFVGWPHAQATHDVFTVQHIPSKQLPAGPSDLIQ